MTLHSNKRRPGPDRRGGRKNQPKPKTWETQHHTHIMSPWGSDPRFTRCTQTGCPYAEVNGKPVIGRKERTRTASDVLEQADLFPWDEVDATRFGQQLGWR